MNYSASRLTLTRVLMLLFLSHHRVTQENLDLKETWVQTYEFNLVPQASFLLILPVQVLDLFWNCSVYFHQQRTESGCKKLFLFQATDVMKCQQKELKKYEAERRNPYLDIQVFSFQTSIRTILVEMGYQCWAASVCWVGCYILVIFLSFLLFSWVTLVSLAGGVLRGAEVSLASRVRLAHRDHGACRGTGVSPESEGPRVLR